MKLKLLTWMFAPLLAMGAGAQSPVKLFDGTTLKGWKALGDGSWTVSNGEIVAKQTASNPHFTHLIQDSIVKDFRMSFQFKTIKGNAGLFFRLQNAGTVPDSLAGVQAVLDPDLQSDDAFGLYETNGRNWLKKWDFNLNKNKYPGGNACMLKHEWPKPIDTDTICRKTLLKPADWNRITILAKGPHIVVKLNMRTIADISDAALDKAGRFAFKLHGGQDVEIHFKDVEISNLPGPRPGLRSRLVKALMYKGENASPPPLREFMKEIASDNGFTMNEGMETDFNKANLAQYQASLFLSDYNVNFTPSQRTDFESWFKAGRGAICIHACTRQEVTIAWPWWGAATGGQLANHSVFYHRTVGLDKEAANLPMWKGFDTTSQSWPDEWFHWVQNPRGKPGLTVILSYKDDGPSDDPERAVKGLPHAWINTSEGGRFFSYGGIHDMNSLELPFTYDFLLNALQDVAGYDTVLTAVNPRAPDKGRVPAMVRTGRGLRVEGAGPYTVELRDVSGKLVYRDEGDATKDVAYNPTSSAGMLFLTIRTGAGVVSTRKILPAF